MKVSTLLALAVSLAVSLGVCAARAESLISRLGFGSYRLSKVNLFMEAPAASGMVSIDTKTNGRVVLYYKDGKADREIVLEVPVAIEFEKNGLIAERKSESLSEETMKIWNAGGLKLEDLLGEYQGFEVSATRMIVNIGESVLFKRLPTGKLVTVSNLQSGFGESLFAYLGLGAVAGRVRMKLHPLRGNRVVELVVSRDRNVSRIFDLTPEMLGSEL